MDDDSSAFKTHFNKLFGHHSVSCNDANMGTKANAVNRQTRYFANLANFIALIGGQLNAISLFRNVARLMSNLYTAHAVIWCESQQPTSKKLYDYCLNRICDENQGIINRIVTNYPSSLRILLRPMTSKVEPEEYQRARSGERSGYESCNFGELERIFTARESEELERLNTMNVNNPKYQDLYQKVIQVGEFDN